MQVQEGMEAEQELEDSFALLADNEQAAYGGADRRVCSLPLPVLDATGQYYGSLRAHRSRRNGRWESSFILCWRGCCSGNVSLFNQRETVAWPIPIWLAMADLARSQACVKSRRVGIEPDAPLASPDSAVSLLDSISASVWVAQFPVVWLLPPLPGESDERPDDVPGLPPEPHRGFLSNEIDLPTSWLEVRHWLPQRHSRPRDPDSPTRFLDVLPSKQQRFLHARSGNRSITLWRCMSTRIVPNFFRRRKAKSSIPSSTTRSPAAVGSTMRRRRIVVGDV